MVFCHLGIAESCDNRNDDRFTAVYGMTICNSDKLFSVDLELTMTKGTLELGGHAAIANVDFAEKTVNVDLE